MDEMEKAMFNMMIQSSLTHRENDKLFDEGKITAAKAGYLRSARKIAGVFATIPAVAEKTGGGVQYDVYLKLNPLEQMNLMGCYLGLAKCCLVENDLEMALAWCEDIASLYRCTYHMSEFPLHELASHNPEMTFLKSAGMCLASEIFKDLGNSATAATRRWFATSSTIDLDTHKTPALKKLLDLGIALKLLESRHPDPQATLTLRVTVPALQVQGSWTRLQVKTPGGFTEGRRLYISGGRKSEQGPYYRDLWTLDLAKLDAWRKLPDYPVPLTTTGNFLGFNMVLHNDTALLFTGRPTIDVFDLKSETWPATAAFKFEPRHSECKPLFEPFPPIYGSTVRADT
ncbi:hypothetical protein R3P38DRAFT_3592813 [Favolaschia claudopus]|uniref:Uncharacterized protein n=1 Tax=Favolaschia claudopus TaxID=2862362 RepID=A0AAW0AFQ2_9AGAR